MIQCAAVIPCYEGQSTVAQVVHQLKQLRPQMPVIVVDDGSTDDSAAFAESAGAVVVQHPRNLGKGSALKTGLARAAALGAQTAVTLDADGQHPAKEAIRLAECSEPADCLLLGVRDLRAASAPRLNRFSNGFSNVFVSVFSGKRLKDTQCGLRRYPVQATLALGARSSGYGFEAEVILRAARQRWRIVGVPVDVIYPAGAMSHFHAVRDPARIVFRVLHTVTTAPFGAPKTRLAGSTDPQGTA